MEVKMFLFKHQNGFYYIHYTDLNGKRQKQSTKVKIKSDAKIIMREFSKIFFIDKQKEISSISLKDYCWKFLKQNEKILAWKTILTYRTTFNALNRFVGAKMLTELTTEMIEDFLRFRHHTTSIYASRKDLINLKSAFKKAVNNGYLKLNPTDSIKRINPPEKMPNYFSDEEYNKLITVIENNDILDIVEFAVNTGLRQMELIQLKNNQFIKTKNLLILDNQAHITKSKKIRTIPLNKKALEIINKKCEARKDFLFTINGENIKQDYLIHEFKKYVRKAELNDKLNFHSLRHTFASRLVQKGISIYQVSKLLGHADVKTTQIYAHLTVNNLASAVSTLDG